MGNYNTRAIKFQQSCNDFPLTVKLGEKLPSWGISRWGGRGGLRFVPPDDEGFTVRGDKRRLVYKGRRRSHRFTILGDTAFEYDCILLREPESNVVSLVMEGAENFEFFRQPEFVKEPLLKGSYAVYKRETLLGEGTGKLCHIHRPQIIDAQGRRCWGELMVTGNRLCITIPETWLGEAAYPVIVDPVVGTSTVGSQNKWVQDVGEDPDTLYFEGTVPVNRFLVPETINGLCTAYFYTNEDDSDAGGRPVFYSDNGNVPAARRSAGEGSLYLRVNGSNPKGWRSATFRSSEAIASGSYIWFGMLAEFFWLPRFDYGAKCYVDWWSEDYDDIPDTYPLWKASSYYDFRLSMYFDYSPAQNYVRVLTQGVSLSHSSKLTGNYKRNTVETVRTNSVLSRFETSYRICLETLTTVMNLNRLPVFIRRVTEYIQAGIGKSEKLSFSRKCADAAAVVSKNAGLLTIIRKIQDGLKGFDRQSFSVLFLRSVTDNATISHGTNHWGAFVRGLVDTAGTLTETAHGAEYHRREADTVQAEGRANRGLLLFVRIITQVFIRDYLLGRFLKARQELVLKSCISREIVMESRID